MFCDKERPFLVRDNIHILRTKKPRQLNPDISQKLEKVLIKSVELDRKKRYRNFKELRFALNSIYKNMFKENSPFYVVEVLDSLASDLNNRGFSYYQLGEEQKARELWEKALKADPKHLEATFNLGCLKWKNAEESWSKLLQKLNRTENRSTNYWLYRGWLHLMLYDLNAIKNIQNSENRIFNKTFLKAIKANNRRDEKKLLQVFNKEKQRIKLDCISPDGKLIMSKETWKIFRLYDVVNGVEIKRFQGYEENGLEPICFSPDSESILYRSDKYGYCLYNLKWKYEKQFDHQEDISLSSICYSNDSKFILYGDYDGIVRLQNIDTFSIKKFKSHESEVTSICFSPDDKSFLSGDEIGTIRLWDIRTKKLIRTFKGHVDRIELVHFSPNGKFILSSSCDGTVRLWDAKSALEIVRYDIIADGLFESVCFSPDSKYILSGDRDGTIRLWDIMTMKVIRSFEGHEGEVTSVNFSSDGRYIISLSADRTIRFWSNNYNEAEIYAWKIIPIISHIIPTSEIISHIRLVKNIFDNSSLKLGSGDYRSAYKDLRHILKLYGFEHNSKVFDLLFMTGQKGEKTKLKDSWIKWSTNQNNHIGPIFQERFSPDCNYILSLDRFDREIQLLDIKSGKRVERFRGLLSYKDSVCYSPNGKFIIYHNERLTFNNKTKEPYNNIRLLDVNNGKIIKSYELPMPWIEWISFSPDGKYILAMDLYSIQLLDVENGSTIINIDYKIANIQVKSACFSPDGRFILLAGDQGISLFDITSKKEIKRFGGSLDNVCSICFSNNGNYILSGGYRKKIIKLMDAVSGIEINRFEKLSYDKNEDYGSNDHKLVLWSFKSRREIGLFDRLNNIEISKFEGELENINSGLFSIDNKFLLSGGQPERTIRLLDTLKGNEIERFENYNDVYSVSFSPDDKYILSVGSEKTIQLWNAESGKEIRSFKNKISDIHSACFSPNGRFIATLHEDYTLRLFELDWELEFPDEVDWHEDAEPLVSNFLTLYNNSWTDEQFESFYQKLQYAGLGWVRKEGVLKKMREMTGNKGRWMN
jgi:WD40 repeat protein